MSITYEVRGARISPSFVQVSAHQYARDSSGLCTLVAEGTPFAVVHITPNSASPADLLDRPDFVTESGLVLPGAATVAQYAPESQGPLRVCYATDGLELYLEVMEMLKWCATVVSVSASGDVCVEARPYGDPCYNTAAADIFLGACREWIDGRDMDDLSGLLE